MADTVLNPVLFYKNLDVDESVTNLVSDKWVREQFVEAIASKRVPSPEQEIALGMVKRSPGWCPEDGCDFVCDAKSISGAKTSLGHHRRKEHSDG